MNEFLRTDTAMSALSSMRTGGIAPVAYFPETEQSLCDTVRRLTEEHKRFFVFGNLSNVLLPDGTLDFVPVITTGIKTVTVTDTDDGIKVYAACGVSLTGLALEFCRRDYAGLSFAYGIPGTVGGAVFMNAGAYGSEMKTSCVRCAFTTSMPIQSAKFRLPTAALGIAQAFSPIKTA